MASYLHTVAAVPPEQAGSSTDHGEFLEVITKALGPVLSFDRTPPKRFQVAVPDRATAGPKARNAVVEAQVGFSPASHKEIKGGWIEIFGPGHTRTIQMTPQTYGDGYLLDISWDPAFWSGYHFGLRGLEIAFAATLSAVRHKLKAAWMLDGPSAIHGIAGQRQGRFIFYRRPEDFVQWFLGAMQLQADAAPALAYILETARSDVLTRDIYAKRPGAEFLESMGGSSGPYKRLRFDSEGGLILEDGRYGFEDADFFGQTADDLLEGLARRMISGGIARRA